jgi:hypothetical protein
MNENDGTFGISHLAGNPIALTYGSVLIVVLLALVLLRMLFGSISVGASGGVK